MKKRRIRITELIPTPVAAGLTDGRIMDVVERWTEEALAGRVWVRDDRGKLVVLFVHEYEWVETGDSQKSAPE